MTVGIYCLQFEGTDKVYIGQSIDIERRFTSHIRTLHNNTAAVKLQKAYNLYGLPTVQILCECLKEELDYLEIEAISLYNSNISGYNSTDGGESGGCGLPGADNGNATFSKEQIINCFKLLCNTDKLFKDIEKETGVSIPTIGFISSGTRHNWLSKEYPEEYSIMLAKNGKRNSLTHCAKSKGIEYPVILSPVGEPCVVDNVNQFAKKYKLDPSNLHKVLTKKIASVKGWRLQ